MKKIALIIALMTLNLAYCQDYDDYEQGSSEKSQLDSFKKEAPDPKLQGIILSDNYIEQDCLDVCINNIDIPNREDNLSKILRGYLNKEINENLLFNIRSEIINYYQKNSRPFILVDLPNQDISNGVVCFVIIESMLSEIKIKSDKQKDYSHIKDCIRLKKGDPLDTYALAKDLYIINKNPFKNAYAVFSKGEEYRTTNIEIDIKEKFPLRVYTGIDNTGNNVVGNNRLFAGIVTNLYKDQLLSYQYTSVSNAKKFQSHTGKYTIPLKCKHFVDLIAGYSYFDVNYQVNDIEGTFNSSGMSLQTSLRYDIPIVLKNNLSELSFGFDFKRTNNNVNFTNDQSVIFAGYANLTQIMASYNIGGTKKNVDWSFEIEGFYSPLKWISDQSNRKYDNIRPHAKNKYAYMRSSGSLLWKLPKEFEIGNFLRWQLANKNLLPSETYGLGGYNTVRGYKERAFNGDLAVLYNFELKLPKMKSKLGDLVLLGFFDIGKAWKNHKAEGEKKHDWLAGIGPGLRYNWKSYITSRLDLGFKLHDKDSLGSKDYKLHFSVVGGF